MKNWFQIRTFFSKNELIKKLLIMFCVLYIFEIDMPKLMRKSRVELLNIFSKKVILN